MRYYLNKLKNQVAEEFYLKPFANTNKQKVSFNSENTLCLFASPRGGSTWLAELLHNIPYSALAQEPLHQGSIITDGSQPKTPKKGLEEIRGLGFWHYQPIPEDAKWDEAMAFFTKLFNRELLPFSLWFDNDLTKIPSAELFIYKFCYANLMLPWLVRNFDIKSILLVRHPCAVVSSQLGFELWQELPQHTSFVIPDCPYNEYFKQYEDVLNTVSTPEENLAATWSLNVANTVLHEDNDVNWRTISYEHLYKEPLEGLQRIFDYLGRPLPRSVMGAVEEPSRNASVSLEDQLDKWKNVLTTRQVNNVLGIVRSFGINIYDESPEPDYKKLYKPTGG